MDERAALVERREVERDPELHRRDRQGPLGVRVFGVEPGDLLGPCGEVTGVQDLLPGDRDTLRVAHRLPVGRGLSRTVQVAVAQRGGVEAEQRGAAAEDVFDHHHALRPAEAAERCLRRLIGLGDPAVHPHVRDPVRVVDVAQGAGQHRLGQVEAPAPVRGEGRVERLQETVVVEADAPAGVEAVPLARHRHVLKAGEPQADRSTGEDCPESRDRREPVRLHLLAAEPAAHPQALHGHLVAGPAEDVRDDLLRLRRVLGAALHEDLLGFVDVGERAVGLQVEVLLARELELAAEHVVRAGQAGLDVAALHVGLPALEAPGGDCLRDREQHGQRRVIDLDGRRSEPGGLDGVGEDPADRVAVEHGLVGEQRFVVLDPGVVDPGDVRGGEHTDDTGDRERGLGAQPGDPGVGVGCLDGVGMQHVLGAQDQVVGVEGLAGDVQRCAFVRNGHPDDGTRGSFGQRAHARASCAVGYPDEGNWAYSLRRAWPSIAERYAALAR